MLPTGDCAKACNDCRYFVAEARQLGVVPDIDGYCRLSETTTCKFPPPILTHQDKQFLQLLLRCRTQMRYAGGGMGPDLPQGFDYTAIRPVLEASGYDLADPEFLEMFQLLESAYVNARSQQIISQIKK